MSKDKDYADKIAMSTGKFVEGILKELTLDFPQDITFSGRYIAGDIHIYIEKYHRHKKNGEGTHDNPIYSDGLLQGL